MGPDGGPLASDTAPQPGEADLSWRIQWPQAGCGPRRDEQLPRVAQGQAPEALNAPIQLKPSFPGGISSSQQKRKDVGTLYIFLQI